MPFSINEIFSFFFGPRPQNIKLVDTNSGDDASDEEETSLEAFEKQRAIEKSDEFPFRKSDGRYMAVQKCLDKRLKGGKFDYNVYMSCVGCENCGEKSGQKLEIKPKPKPELERKPEPKLERRLEQNLNKILNKIPERKPKPEPESKLERRLEQNLNKILNKIPERKPKRKPKPKSEPKLEHNLNKILDKIPERKLERKPERKAEPKLEQRLEQNLNKILDKIPKLKAEQKSKKQGRSVFTKGRKKILRKPIKIANTRNTVKKQMKIMSLLNKDDDTFN